MINDANDELGKSPDEAQLSTRKLELQLFIQHELPEFAKMCAEADVGDQIVMSQDAFAGNLQNHEYALLGKAIKYAGLKNLTVHIGPGKE